MAWSNVPATAGQDFQDISWRNQFVEAIRERVYASEQAISDWSGYLTTNAGAIGDDGQLASDVGSMYCPYQMQEWIEMWCSSFVPSNNYIGEATITPYSWTTLKSAAGLSSSGWTRLTDSGTYYGRSQAGDYITPELFNEIYQCLNLLTKYLGSLSTTSITQKNIAQINSFTSAEDAHADFVTRYNAASTSTPTSYGTSWTDMAVVGSDYYCGGLKKTSKYAYTWGGVLDNLFTATRYVYHKASGVGTWNDQGDNVLENLYTLHSTASVDPGVDALTSEIHDINTPPDAYLGTNGQTGYVIYDVKYIMDYSSSFTYI